MVNRKLVRPNLAEIKERMALQSHQGPPDVAPTRERGERGERGETGGGGNGMMRRRPAPPESTAAEAFYYLKQMNGKTPMVVVLDSGEQLRGHIEWYDRSCIKVHREGNPNLLVFKHAIRYMYKEEEELGRSTEEH